MKRLLPATLFGRLVLVLLAGLIAAQLLAAVILLHNRGLALYEASGLHTIQRIADIVRVLDTVGPAEGKMILPAVNTPFLKVAFTDAPSPAPESNQEEGLHAAHLRSVLQRSLGDNRPLRITITETERAEIENPPARTHPHRAMHPHGPPLEHVPLFGGFAGRGVFFFIQVQLRDGRWVSFEHRLSQEQFAWPVRLLLTLGILLVSVILLSLLAVRWLTRPLTLLGNAALQLGRDIHHPPLEETGPEEVRHAAAAFNTMQSRLARYVKDREQMLAAVSHDLRTPITRLRLRAETLDDTDLKTKVLHDLDDMETMVNAALEFMRDTNYAEAIQPVDITALLESIQGDMEEMGKEVQLSGQAQRPFPARPSALKRCFTNLLDNAVNYGERAMVTIEDTPQWLRVTIADTGPGIPQEDLANVFEPFVRLDSSRSSNGAGLGLSIARNIAHAHGGDLILRNRKGGGLEAVLTLPRVPEKNPT